MPSFAHQYPVLIVSHCETHFLCLSVYFRTLGQFAAWQYHDLVFVGKTDGGGLGRSIGYQTSLHSHGGAFCSVTCSQRKYHCPPYGRHGPQSCLWLLSALVFLASAPADRLDPYGTYLFSLFGLGEICFTESAYHVAVCLSISLLLILSVKKLKIRKSSQKTIKHNLFQHFV